MNEFDELSKAIEKFSTSTNHKSKNSSELETPSIEKLDTPTSDGNNKSFTVHVSDLIPNIIKNTYHALRYFDGVKRFIFCLILIYLCAIISFLIYCLPILKQTSYIPIFLFIIIFSSLFLHSHCEIFINDYKYFIKHNRKYISLGRHSRFDDIKKAFIYFDFDGFKKAYFLIISMLIISHIFLAYYVVIGEDIILNIVFDSFFFLVLYLNAYVFVSDYKNYKASSGEHKYL